MSARREWLEQMMDAAKRVIDELDASAAPLSPAVQELRADLLEPRVEPDAGAAGLTQAH